MFEQDRVLVRLQQYVLRDEQIFASFLAGSHGRDANDAYSDLDLLLVYKDEESRALAYANRSSFVRSVLPYLSAKSFDAAHVKPYMHIALYGNGAKVDFVFETVDMEPAFELCDMRILKENQNWAAAFLDQCSAQPASFKRPTAAAGTLSALDDRFWIMFMDTFRRLLRGDHDTPFPIYIQLIYFTVPTLLELLPSEDPGHQALIDIQYTADTKFTIKHLQLLLKAYLEARAAVVKRHNLYLPIDESFERELIKIIDRS